MLVRFVGFLALLVCCTAAHAADPAEFVKLLDQAPLVDEVNLGIADPGHHFTADPQDCSALATLAGVHARVIASSDKPGLIAVRLGEGKGLVARDTYCLEVDVVEDAPRTFFIINRGDNTFRGVICGASVPDTFYQYTECNPEVLDLPLAKGVRTWRSVFRLHEHTAAIKLADQEQPYPLTPADGFWVLIAHPEARRMPGSAGAAVSAIRLRRIADPTTLEVAIHRPPKELPWRHAFWREEMADGVFGPQEPERRGMSDPVQWYEHKLQMMRMVGIDVFCKDLLEFGHNQGWDSAPYGGNDWVYQSSTPDLWSRLVNLAGKAGIAVLPYYEYTGSVGAHSYGIQRRARPLGDEQTYTHITWSEKANVDVTDPETLADFTKILDCTVLKLKDQAQFLGVWLRPRPSAIPISFADATLKRFADATGTADVTRERLRSEAALRTQYYAWWNLQRRDFLVGVRDLLRQGGVPDATVLFTANSAEPTPGFMGDALVVEGDTKRWETILNGPNHKPKKVMTLAEATAGDDYLQTVLRAPSTWGQWEWNHACPPSDPANYTTTDGVVMTYPYNRAYTATVRAGMEAFRAPAGLAMVRHQSLNERVLPEEMLGYECIDTERSGPACMLPEILAVANGDPRWLGVLSGMSWTTGYPQYVREFYPAFLALPALPSQVLEQAAGGAKGVVVRRIDGGTHGTWLAVVNTGYVPAPGTVIKLPVSGAVTDAATGVVLPTAGQTLKLNLAACSLRAIHIAR